MSVLGFSRQRETRINRTNNNSLVSRVGVVEPIVEVRDLGFAPYPTPSQEVRLLLENKLDAPQHNVPGVYFRSGFATVTVCLPEKV